MPTEPLSEGDRLGACLAHLCACLGFVLPLGNVLAPLGFYLIYKNKSDYIKRHAAEAFNFQVTLTIVTTVLWIVAVVLAIAKLGFFIEWLVGVFQNPGSWAWPDMKQVGSTLLLVLVVTLAFAGAALVSILWNVVEVIYAASIAWRGEFYRYFWIWRPLIPPISDKIEIA